MKNEALNTTQGNMETKAPTNTSGEGVKRMGLNTTDSSSIPCVDTSEGNGDDGEQAEKKMKRILANRCACWDY